MTSQSQGWPARDVVQAIFFARRRGGAEKGCEVRV